MRGKSFERSKKKVETPALKPNPVALLNESEQLANTILINNMSNPKEKIQVKPSSNVFTGGFKYRPEGVGVKKVENILSNLNPSKMDKFTVYDEFGLINDSIGKKKYRQNSKQERTESLPTNSMMPLSQNNPWKKENQSVAQNNFVDPNYYEISKAKEREQTAAHVKSSLEVINLENIEAKLEAHRISMKPIEEQYNVMKGKSVGEVKGRSPEKLRFNIDVDKEYKNMQPQKVYEFIKQKQVNMDRPEQQLLMEELWEQRKRKDPKLAEYDFKYQQFLVQKQAKKMIGSVVKQSLFSWDKYAKTEDIQKRKMAQKHKSKEKNYGEQIQSKVLSKVYGTGEGSPSKEPAPDMVSSVVDLQERIASKDDKFIGKYIMAQIDVDKRGTISKDELVQYLSSKDHLINGYHIDLKWLHTDLDGFETKRKGMLNQNEVVNFLATLNSLHHPQMVLKQVQKPKANKVVAIEQGEKDKLITSYFKKNAGRFERVFNLIDVCEDRIIKREQYIQSIYLDSDCVKIIDQPVLKFNMIDKSISFRQILGFILDDYRKQKNQKLKKSKEYITFQRFKEYFELPECLDLKVFDRSSHEKLKQQKYSSQIEMFDLDEQNLLMLKDIYATIPRIYQQYIVVSDFVSIAMKDPQIMGIENEMCRIQSVQTGLPVESIKSTLIRMTRECDQYATWDVLKTYFSRRGRPLDWDLELINKKKQVRQNKLKAGAELAKTKMENFDSNNEEDLQRRPFLGDTIKPKRAGTSVDRYTVPQPFNITDQKVKARMNSKQMSSQQKQIQEMKKKFRAKPVNKDILMPNPDLIQGKVAKAEEKNVYNYQNYEKDRVERVLKKAQEQFELAEQLKQIKRMSEMKSNKINVDLTKKLEDVMKEKKKDIEQKRPKRNIPEENKLCPKNPKEEEAKKLKKIKEKMKKQKEAEKAREEEKQKLKKQGKLNNEKARRELQEKKKKEEEEQKLKQRGEGSYKPKINKYVPDKNQLQKIAQAQTKRKEKLQEQAKALEMINKKKQERLNFKKKQDKPNYDTWEDDQIFEQFDEIDFEELLVDAADRKRFRKQYDFKEKTRKEIKQRYRGLAGRESAAMEAQQKRLAEEKKALKQQKQAKNIKIIQEKGKQFKKQINSGLNMQQQCFKSKALRRYRMLLQNKEPPEQYDDYLIPGTGKYNLGQPSQISKPSRLKK